jgi:DNA excision repair protein ERCC-8
MQAHLVARETGDLSAASFARTITTDLVRSFAPAPQHRFNGDLSTASTSTASTSASAALDEARPHKLRAHGAGVSCLAVDKFDGRLLLSGGAEGAIKLWDLEDAPASQHTTHTFRPAGNIPRSTGSDDGEGHSHGITHLGFYPFDPDAFLSSSYDKTLKLWSTQRVAVTASFDLNATIYSHATSPIADHLLVACATQHAHVRLVDLRSGSAVQGLVAHGGPVLSTAWSPRHEHVLVSGHADGKVRVWDVRRAGGVIGQLDQEDALGAVHRFRHAVATGMEPGRVPPFRAAAQAHDEAVNALQWTADGRHIVSAGLDGRIRVWDAATGANTLASFGSVVQNRHAKTASVILSPPGLSTHQELLFWANDNEILVLDLHHGDLIARLRSPGATNPVGPRGAEMGRNRISSIVWRGAGGEARTVGPAMGGGNSIGAIYSSHLDGHIRAWMPQMPGPDDLDEEEERDDDEDARQKKRKAIDSAYRSLMGKRITFT